MAKLNHEQQAWFVTNAPESFAPATGAWGERGAMMIDFDRVEESDVRRSLNAAWRNTAPKKLVRMIDEIE